MPKPTAIVVAERCRPERCERGICLATRECPRRILRQEAPYEVPFIHGDSSLCRGCFKCLAACPLKAIAKG